MSDLEVGIPEVSEVYDINAKAFTGVQARAIDLLGQGIDANMVSQTLGVSESYISQLLSQDEFKRQVVERRYQNLQKHNERDARWDAIEDKMLVTMEAQASLIFDPMKAAKIAQIANAAKRRGQSSPDSILQQSVVVNLTMPTVVMDRFRVIKDVNNQVIEAGDQKLVTIQSGTLLDRAKKNGVDAREALLANSNPPLPSITRGPNDATIQNRTPSFATQNAASERRGAIENSGS